TPSRPQTAANRASRPPESGPGRAAARRSRRKDATSQRRRLPSMRRETPEAEEAPRAGGVSGEASFRRFSRPHLQPVAEPADRDDPERVPVFRKPFPKPAHVHVQRPLVPFEIKPPDVLDQP